MSRLAGWVALLSVFACPAAGQLGGTVTDPAGRPLPFAVVVSRTNNGFLGVLTGPEGRFHFPDRPHRPGHTIVVTSAGYERTVYRLQPGDSDLRIPLAPSGAGGGAGWALGLGEVDAAILLTADGRALTPGRDSLSAGRYRVRVRLEAAGECLRLGPTAAALVRDTAVAVQGVFGRAGPGCAAPPPVAEIPVTVGGTPVVRIVGRRRDLVLDFR